MSTNNFPNTLEVDIIFVSDIHNSFPDKKIEGSTINNGAYTYRNETMRGWPKNLETSNIYVIKKNRDNHTLQIAIAGITCESGTFSDDMSYSLYVAMEDADSHQKWWVNISPVGENSD